MNKFASVLFISAALLFSAGLSAQKMTASDKLRMIDADENFQKEFYQEAFAMYKDIVTRYPEHPEANYKAGKTAYTLNLSNEALAYLTKAVQLKPGVGKDGELWLGRAQHKSGMLDAALGNFEKFKATLKGKAAETHIVNEHIYQINLAKKLIAMPVDVTITNMGAKINSEYIESNPSITADGNTFIFATCRPENTGGQIDLLRGIYFQDVWISERDSVTGQWTEAEPIEGEINTKEHDACLSISPDGSVIFIYRSVKGGDIYYSRKKKNGEWRAPEPLMGKANTTYFETSASMTADKRFIYFISERPGKGQGNGDIWTAKRSGKFEYDEAENLGKVINSIDDESSVFLHPNGKTIYFSSNYKNSIGGYDIFKSDFVDGKWGAPVNLGYPINTFGDETQFSITADGNKAYITAKRDDTMGDFDLYEVDLSRYSVPDPDGNVTGSKTISVGESISILRGKILDKTTGETLEAKIQIADESGKEIASLESDESGQYFVTLDGNQTYTISVRISDFKDYSETVFLPKTPGKTEIIVKTVFMTEE